MLLSVRLSLDPHAREAALVVRVSSRAAVWCEGSSLSGLVDVADKAEQHPVLAKRRAELSLRSNGSIIPTRKGQIQDGLLDPAGD